MKKWNRDDCSEVESRWEGFWRRERLDRPYCVLTAPRHPLEPVAFPKYMAGSDGRTQEAIRDFESWMNATYFLGEAVPFFDVSFGPDQFSAFLGANLAVHPDENTSWVEPCVEDWKNLEINIERPGGILDRMLQFMGIVAEKSAGKYPVGMPDLHSGMDCLSAMRGPQSLCMDLMDQPEVVEAALKQVRAAYAPIVERIREAGKMDQTGFIGWSPAFSKTSAAVIQCDFICMIGPDDFRRFVLPVLIDEAEQSDHVVFHLDGKEALRHLDDLLSIPGIDVVQWVPGAGQPRTIHWMELLQRIQEEGKSVWVYDWTPEEIAGYADQLDPARTLFSVAVQDCSEGEKLLDTLIKKFH